ncbi:hypothetical protein HY638_00970 [Candidatus Woesearchaeota archaeon]|nr:hypothetical protein [Candidatus Woesearchaeota archaeon]
MDSGIFKRGPGYYLKKFMSASRLVLFSRFRANILLIVVLVGIAVYAGYLIAPSKGNSPTAYVSLSTALEEKSCPACPEAEVPEINKTECVPEKINTIYYQCSDGLLVNDTEYCNVMPNITSPDYGYTDGFTLSIDGITFVEEDREQQLYRIKWINYTILNQGKHDIVPLIEVRVYDKWDQKIAAQYPQKVIQTTDVLTSGEYLRSSVVSNIVFSKLPKTVRLSLKNKMDEKGEGILAVTTTLRE